uniref:Uncharacterized protein n=1 Tax=Oryza glaberrima TaxID=4538 RepID=I1R2Z1_ORYGL
MHRSTRQMLEKKARQVGTAACPAATRVSRDDQERALAHPLACYVVPCAPPERSTAPLRARFRHPPRHPLTTNGQRAARRERVIVYARASSFGISSLRVPQL